MPVSVALKRHGRKPGKMKLKLTAIGTGQPKRDADTVKLICTP
jgi:hypothetical protein